MENSECTKMIQLLLKIGMSRDILTHDTVLRCIKDSANSDSMVKLLIEMKVDFSELVDKDLHVAKMVFFTCQNKSIKYLQYFVDLYNDGIAKIKCDVNHDGENALHITIWNQRLSALQLLLEKIYFPNGDLKNKDGISALNQPTKYGETPVVYACRKKSRDSLEIFKLLLKYGCKLTPLKLNSWFALYAASYYNHTTILKYMIDNKIGTNTINTRGDSNYLSTPLMAALATNSVGAVQLLLSFNRTDIDHIKSKFMNNYTALEYGVYFGNYSTLRMVLCAVLRQNNVSDWTSFENANIHNRLYNLEKISEIGTDKHNKNWKPQSNDCKMMIRDLIKRGIKRKNYNYIAWTLRYTVSHMFKDDSMLPNKTVMVNYVTKKLYESKTALVSKNTTPKHVARWRIGEVLGNGAFGNVLKGYDIDDKREVALKYVSINKLCKSRSKKSKIVSFIMNELQSVELVDHKNVIKLLAYNLNVDNKGTMLLVFEYASCGELYQFLAIVKYFNDDIAKTYFEQILDALEICHSMDIIHRDLKPQNILVDSQYQVKVADFGLSTYDNDLTNKNLLYVGTRGYMSPEIASPMIDDYDENDNPIYKEITPLCDIFSLGVILWQLLNGIESMPFDEATEYDPKYVFITQKEFDLFWKCHYSCRIVKRSSHHILDLLLKMFTFNCDKRITITDIRNNKWYTQVKGYNNEESQQSFQNIMHKIHMQSKSTARLQSQSASQNTAQYQSTLVSNPNATKKTNFKFDKLRYVTIEDLNVVLLFFYSIIILTLSMLFVLF